MQSTRKKLNQGQLDVLEFLYRFRFGTTTLLAQGLGLKDGTYVNSRLSILVKQNLIGRNYDNSYKLQGKPASYYLLPDSFKFLKQQVEVVPKVLKNIYKDKSASQRFINHNLAVFGAQSKLSVAFGDGLEFFTKTDLSSEAYDYFPDPLPDAFMSIKISNKPRTRAKLFFLMVLDEDAPFFINVRRVKQLMEYTDSGDWDATGKKLPAVLAICESATLQKRLHKRLASMEDVGEDFRLYTVTKPIFMNSDVEDEAIWQPVGKPGVLLSLDSI